VAVPEAVAGLAAIPGVRTAAQLGEQGLDTSASVGSLPLVSALAKLMPGGVAAWQCCVGLGLDRPGAGVAR
jgi:hypothetical protein